MPEPAVLAEARVAVCGLSYAAAGANVIMQLSQLPIGRTVALSAVDSGRVDKHPIKRLRTTSAYLMIAMFGTDQERLAMRGEVNGQHRQAGPSAFDPQLQLWVAACLYKGIEDVFALLRHEPPSADFYRYCSRLGTTLQVPGELWPADRAAFEQYWNAALTTIEMDDVSRAYLQGVAGTTFLGPLARPLAPLSRLLTVGFLPEPFRDELGLPWDSRRQAVFDRVTRLGATVTKLSPRPLREFPYNVYLADTRKRIREGRAIV